MTEEKGKRERNRRDGEKRNNSPKRDNADEGRGGNQRMTSWGSLMCWWNWKTEPG